MSWEQISRFQLPKLNLNNYLLLRHPCDSHRYQLVIIIIIIIIFFYYLTHTIYHISHITHNNQTLLGMTEFVKHGAEYENGYSKYHEYMMMMMMMMMLMLMMMMMMMMMQLCTWTPHMLLPETSANRSHYLCNTQDPHKFTYYAAKKVNKKVQHSPI